MLSQIKHPIEVINNYLWLKLLSITELFVHLFVCWCRVQALWASCIAIWRLTHTNLIFSRYLFRLAPIAMLYWSIKTINKETEFVLRRLLIGCTLRNVWFKKLTLNILLRSMSVFFNQILLIQIVPEIQPDQQNSTNSVSDTYPSLNK